MESIIEEERILDKKFEKDVSIVEKDISTIEKDIDKFEKDIDKLEKEVNILKELKASKTGEIKIKTKKSRCSIC